MLEQTSGTIPVWRGGERVERAPFVGRYRLTLENGETGAFAVMGHPEAITVPQVVPTRDAMCIGTLGAGLDRLLIYANAQVGAGVSPRDALSQIADRVEADPQILMTPAVGSPLPALIGAVAVGCSGGERRSIVAMPGGPTDGSMSVETGRVAALGVELILDVPVGVHAPETAFDPDHFLAAFSEREWGAQSPAYRVAEVAGNALVPEAA